MGAVDFMYQVSGSSAKEAFHDLVETERDEYGSDRYSGTIATKERFRMVTPLQGELPNDCAKRCRDDEEHWVQDKWGSAACIDCGPSPSKPGLTVFLFFGYAPS